jgi:nucleoid DNA-binding protein
MPVKIIAKPNPLQKDGSYLPVILRQPSLGLPQILEYMAKDTALEVTDMKATLEHFEEAVRYLLTKGFRLETNLGSYGLVAKGSLASEEAAFDPGNPDSSQSLAVDFRPTKALKEYLNQHSQIERIPYEGPKGALIKSLRNLSSPDTQAFRSGDVLQITGLRLRCRLDHPQGDEGLFFLDQGGQATPAPFLITNTDHQLTTQIPAALQGPYTLEVRNRGYRTSLFTGRYPQAIQIIP